MTTKQLTTTFSVESFGQQASGQPNSVTVTSSSFETLEEAEALAAQFPKFVNAKVQGSRQWNGTANVFAAAWVRVTVDLRPKAGNAVNEGGLKRLAKTLEVAGRLGEVQ